MNWFKRHLNWTIGIGLLAYFVLGNLFLYSGVMVSDPLLTRILILLWTPLAFLIILIPSGELGDKVPNVSNVVFLFSVLIPVVWAFRQKKRSWMWLLLPLGWIFPLIFKSKQKILQAKETEIDANIQKEKHETSTTESQEKEYAHNVWEIYRKEWETASPLKRAELNKQMLRWQKLMKNGLTASQAYYRAMEEESDKTPQPIPA